jgi:hypothetical protein
VTQEEQHGSNPGNITQGKGDISEKSNDQITMHIDGWPLTMTHQKKACQSNEQ